jgi:monoamine oxidase
MLYSTFYADHVIVTCSLGHLKQYHDSLFNPALPKCKVDAIERMGFGNVEKVFLYYEPPFWSTPENPFGKAKSSSAISSPIWYNWAETSFKSSPSYKPKSLVNELKIYVIL